MNIGSITRQVSAVPLAAAAVAIGLTISACGGSSPHHATKVAAVTPTIAQVVTYTAPPSKRTKRHHAHKATRVKTTTAAKTTPAVAGKSTTQTQPVTHTEASTTTTKSPSSSKKRPTSTTRQSTKARAPKPNKKPKPTTPKRIRPPTVTTIAATSVAPTYTGPDPLYCLQKIGLNYARTGAEQNVWQANMPGSVPTDSKATIFVAGPYATSTEASQYATELLNVPETASAAGRWVVSAAVTGHLDFQVNAVASCLAG